ARTLRAPRRPPRGAPPRGRRPPPAPAGRGGAGAPAAPPAAQLARRRAIESFPAQVERSSAVDDRLSPTEARPQP
ncbi:hypothetical protein, partial [Kitasatospora sp. NPDC059817]|uniref:hypothetical protein n=1 Tax=Kitasatospora sp. NPDC059817 TaxID=3346961 RepID=UPI003646D833